MRRGNGAPPPRPTRSPVGGAIAGGCFEPHAYNSAAGERTDPLHTPGIGYHVSMGDLVHARRAEGEAERQYSEAADAVFNELMEKGVGGTELLQQLRERCEPLRDNYEQKRFERMVEERDENMLRRGTRRGMLIVGGTVCLLLSALAVRVGFTEDAFFIYVGCVGAVCAGWSFYTARRLLRIPPLGEENE